MKKTGIRSWINCTDWKWFRISAYLPTYCTPANDAVSTTLRGGWTRHPSAKKRHHNRRETSETTPHVHHLTFSLQLHRIFHSLLDWNRFNGHLITFLIFIVSFLWHLFNLLIPVTHLNSIKYLKMSERNWGVSKWSTHIILISSSHPPPHIISPVMRGHLPPSANQQQFIARFYICWYNATVIAEKRLNL